MLETVLVADRGLVGARVVRAAQALGARAVVVAVQGEPSPDADEAVLLGPPGSDLDVVKVVEAARQVGADVVHPGAGPLAASPELAAAVVAAGLAWAGPSPEHLGGTPVLPAARVELQCVDGQVVDARAVEGGVVRAGAPLAGSLPLLAPTAPESGVVSVVDDLVVPHLDLGALVSEVATGLDLAGLQLRTAAGHDVAWTAVPRPTAAAVVRGTGTVTRLVLPDGALTACRAGEPVPPDGVVALVVATGASAAEADAALRAALAVVVVEGADVVVPDLEELRA